MLSSTAIVSLACLLSTGEVDSTKVVENLNQQELIAIEQVIKSGACQKLPDSFSSLIQTVGGPSMGPSSDF